jgi:hypothetical protein
MNQEITMNEAAKKVWHEGIAPLLSVESLQALRDAVERDDPALIQGANSLPPPILATSSWACEGACAIAYCGWKGDELTTVGEVDDFFGMVCHECNTKLSLGDYAPVRYFLNYWDETPRPQLLSEFLPEVEKSLLNRLENELLIQ